MELTEEKVELKMNHSQNGGKCEQGSISLCMIVKNEENNLSRCLDSVANTVDEIIIVDTGSTDKTVEIAESYGARVFSHPWEGSFSKARNYSLDYPTCEWVMILDADEELQESDVQMLKEVVKDNHNSSVSFVIKNKYKDSTQEGYARMVRLFRNFNGVHYEGIVHNMIMHSGTCFDSSLSIIHHGYNLSEDKMEEKFVRTSTLLQKQIEKDLYNPVPYMYLGNACMDRGMYDEAITNSRRALSLAEKQGFNQRDFLVSYYVVSAAYFEKGELEEAETYALKAIKLDYRFLDGYCILSFACYNQKKYERFLQASENYLTLWDSVTSPYSVRGGARADVQTNVINHTIGHKWKIHLLRGFYYLSNNQVEVGNSEIDIAGKKSTDIENYLTLLGNFYMDNDIDKAEEAYKELLDINEGSIEALFSLGLIRFKKGDIENTLLIWKKAVDLEPASFDIRLLICKINISQGNIEDVVDECDQLLQILDMPRDMTLESTGDLAEIFNSISDKLKEGSSIQSAETASNICEELRHVSRNSPDQE